MKEIYKQSPNSYIHLGDSLKIMDEWIENFKEKVDLVFIDPPSPSGLSFKIIQKIGLNQGKITHLKKIDKPLNETEYINLMENVLSKSKTLLSNSGNIFVYCTPVTSSLFKNILDNTFGKSSFMNEIIYKHNRGGNSEHHFSRNHDSILFYRKSQLGYFDPKPTAKLRGRQRRNHMKRNVAKDGRVYYSIVASGKEYKYYEDDLLHLDDVWEDIDESHDNDRYKYEGQKPTKLLERIIMSACPEKGLVCDPFCKIGTTGIAAAKLKRRFLLCDSSHLAINIAKSTIAQLNTCFSVTWDSIDILSEKPEAKFTFKEKKVHLDDYRITGGEKYYSNNLLPTEDTLVEYWSVGRIIGENYFVDDFDLRTDEKPWLGRYLNIKDGDGEPYALTYDVFGNQIAHKLMLQ